MVFVRQDKISVRMQFDVCVFVNVVCVKGAGTNGDPVHPIPRAKFYSSADQTPILIELFFGLKSVAGISCEISDG
jgi:hypothetical protein